MGTKATQSVAVIGAGISGVVAAAHLIKDGLDVTVFERSVAAGGVWVYDERIPLEPAYPSILASQAENPYDAEGSLSIDSLLEAELLHAPPGPCYVGLKNNVGTRMLTTTLNSFPKGTPDFVSHSILREYIQDTARKSGVHDRTWYNTNVKNVRKSGDRWLVDTNTSREQVNGNFITQRTIWNFDSVVVASGHYHAPRTPDTPGLAEWKRRWPSRIEHSKRYRRPEGFAGKNVLIIGASTSSFDIAKELSPLVNKIYQSRRGGKFDFPASLLPQNAIAVDEVDSFDLPKSQPDGPLNEEDPIPGTITLKSGRTLCDIHHVILATGYHIIHPFLSHLHSDDTPVELADDKVLVTDGTQRHNLHKDIFYIPDPSLAFIGVPFFTATFTLFEFQAIVLAKVLSGKVALPSEEQMREEYAKRVKAKGFGKTFHSLRGQEEDYVNELLEWVNRDLEKLGLERVKGHTDTWHEAKQEQVARMEAMFAGSYEPDVTLELVCL